MIVEYRGRRIVCDRATSQPSGDLPQRLDVSDHVQKSGCNCGIVGIEISSRDVVRRRHV